MSQVGSGSYRGEAVCKGTVQQLLAPWRATEDFDDLPIPFRAVAADITNGKPVVMDDGDLSTAVFASMSIPAAFPSVERQG